jgi:CheY-like chemotaxis protein
MSLTLSRVLKTSWGFIPSVSAQSDLSVEEVLERLVLTVEAASSAGDLMASVLLLDEAGEHLMHGAAPSLPAAYNEAINGVEIGPNVGSCGTAAFLGQPVYVADIAKSPLWKDFRDLALAHGLRACWSTPIRGRDGKVLGTFAIYHPTPRAPAPEEVECVRAISEVAAEAIEQGHPVALRQSPNATPSRPRRTAAERRDDRLTPRLQEHWQSRRTYREPTRRMSVLVVEDDDSVRKSTVRALKQEGFEVLEASSGEEGLAVCATAAPDVLLTDIQLPGALSGWDVAERCRESKPRIPVIYMTAHCGNRPRPVPKSVILNKPYTRLELMEALRSLVQAHAVATPVGPSEE